MENMTVYPMSRKYRTYVWTILRRQEAPLHFSKRLQKFRIKQLRLLNIERIA